MKGMTLKELNHAVGSGKVAIKAVEEADTSSLRGLHNSIFRVSDSERTIYRCEACRQVQNSKVVEPKNRQPGIDTILDACKKFWGPAYVPVNFCHGLDGEILDPERIEMMLIGFAPGGATNAARESDIDLIDIHSVALGLKWADYGRSGAIRNRSNIEYILRLINNGVGERDYFSIGRNIHMTNVFKCRSYGTRISPFKGEAKLCYERYLKNEIALLPNLKVVIMFMQEQNFPPLIRTSDRFGTFRFSGSGLMYAYMWHFSPPGFNTSRKCGYYHEFCPKLGRVIRERLL